VFQIQYRSKPFTYEHLIIGDYNGYHPHSISIPSDPTSTLPLKKEVIPPAVTITATGITSSICLYLLSCSSIFNRTVTASALVVVAFGSNLLPPLPDTSSSFFKAPTAPFAHAEMWLSSAKP